MILEQDTISEKDIHNVAKVFIRTLNKNLSLFSCEQIFSESNVVFDIVQQKVMDVLLLKHTPTVRVFSHLYEKSKHLTIEPEKYNFPNI